MLSAMTSAMRQYFISTPGHHVHSSILASHAQRRPMIEARRRRLQAISRYIFHDAPRKAEAGAARVD